MTKLVKNKKQKKTNKNHTFFLQIRHSVIMFVSRYVNGMQLSTLTVIPLFACNLYHLLTGNLFCHIQMRLMYKLHSRADDCSSLLPRVSHTRQSGELLFTRLHGEA